MKLIQKAELTAVNFENELLQNLHTSRIEYSRLFCDTCFVNKTLTWGRGSI